MQQHHIFGTDGVRGRVGTPPMTPQVVMQLAQAYGSLLVEQVGSPAAATSIHLDRPAVVVGTDTRISCSMLEAALQAGFAAAGVDTVLCGVLPTPGVAYIARLRGFQAGVVVSASHNRFEDNGIKLFSGRGDKLDDEVEAAIERRMGEPLACVPSRQLGQGWRMPTAAGLYVDFCKRSLPADVGLYGMRIVIDAGLERRQRFDPATGAVAALRERRLGAIRLAAPGETVCGDNWAAQFGDGRAALLVADGLGHGPHACDAADAPSPTAEEEEEATAAAALPPPPPACRRNCTPWPCCNPSRWIVGGCSRCWMASPRNL